MRTPATRFGLAGALAMLAASGPMVSAAAADPQRVVDVETLRREIVGKPLVNPAIDVRVVIRANGTISGTLRDEALTGQWEFRNGYFCRSYRTRSEIGPVDCQTMSFDETGVTLIYRQGRGHHERYQFAE